MQQRLRDVQKLTGMMWQTFKTAEQLFQSLARVKMDASRLDAYLQLVYPLTDKQRSEKKRPVRWDCVAGLF
jgi:hypothetical protein